MQQVFRIAIVALLAFTQLFAPLVHAHTGSGQPRGTLHVPGLEFLATFNGNSAQKSAGFGGCPDVIVVMAAGLENQDNYAIPVPDPEDLLLVISGLAVAPSRGAWALAPPRYTPFIEASWLKPSPRAPPQLG